MDTILTINIVIAVVFTCCYAYQLFFLAVPFTKKQEPHKPRGPHRFAILICARNEEAVIADLIQSIRHQTYDQSLLTVFVMADNCTDATADIARREGAVVYTRINREKVGKGYAQQLFCITEDRLPQGLHGLFSSLTRRQRDCLFPGGDEPDLFQTAMKWSPATATPKLWGQLDFRRLCPVVYPGNRT